MEDQIDLANERAVRDGVTSIQAGVEAWAADRGGRYPAADRVDQFGLASVRRAQLPGCRGRRTPTPAAP